MYLHKILEKIIGKRFQGMKRHLTESFVAGLYLEKRMALNISKRESARKI